MGAAGAADRRRGRSPLLWIEAWSGPALDDLANHRHPTVFLATSLFTRKDMMNRTSTSLLVLACAAAVSCGGEKPPSPAPTPAAAAVPPAGAATGEIGIPECDEYIRKYEACLRDKVPASQRAMLEQALDQHRSTWRTAAAQPQARATLASSCQQVLSAAKMSMGPYGCQW